MAALFYIDFKKQHWVVWRPPMDRYYLHHNMGYGYYEVLAKLCDDTPVSSSFGHEEQTYRGCGAVKLCNATGVGNRRV